MLEGFYICMWKKTCLIKSSLILIDTFLTFFIIYVMIIIGISIPGINDTIGPLSDETSTTLYMTK